MIKLQEDLEAESVKEPLVMSFTSNAYNDIINTVGDISAEAGGLLFGSLNDYVVREFIYDEDAYTTGGSYTFNLEFLNKIIKELWQTKQLACIGFLHSHPWSMKRPSYADLRYFMDSNNWMPRERLLVPIVSTIPDGGFNLNPCIMFPGDRDITVADKIEILVEPHVSRYKHICEPSMAFSSFGEDVSEFLMTPLDEKVEAVVNKIEDFSIEFKKSINGLFKDLWSRKH